MIDVIGEINAARRRVGSGQLAAREAHVVSISRSYPTTVEDMWDACTTPERLARWFLPVSGDLALGGRYQFEGNAGGTIEACDPPHGFAATWEFGDDISRIEVRLSESAGMTVFELDHTNNLNDHWTEFGPGATGVGWELALCGLGLYLSPNGLDKAAVEAWSVSDEGRDFVTRCARSWGEADIAGGADETEARAAAKRTEATYTAPPAPSDDSPQ